MALMEKELRRLLDEGADFVTIREALDKIEAETKAAKEKAAKAAAIATARTKLVEVISDYAILNGLEVTPEDCVALEKDLIELEKLLENSADLFKAQTFSRKPNKVNVSAKPSKDCNKTMDDRAIQEFLNTFLGEGK